MVFSTSQDATAKNRTAGFALMVISYTSMYLLMFQEHWEFPLVMFLLFAFVFLFAFLLKPYEYEITDSDIIVHRFIGKVVIQRKDILSIEKVPNELPKFIRGGLWGYVGRLYTTDMGKVTFYGTRRSKMVLLITQDGKKIILTPDEPERFIQEFQH